MDEGTKKTVLIGVIGVCLVAAGAVYYSTRGPDRGIGSIPAEKTTWMLCRSGACGHTWEMNLREYFKFVQDNADPRILVAPPFPCRSAVMRKAATERSNARNAVRSLREAQFPARTATAARSAGIARLKLIAKRRLPGERAGDKLGRSKYG